MTFDETLFKSGWETFVVFALDEPIVVCPTPTLATATPHTYDYRASALLYSLFGSTGYGLPDARGPPGF